MFRTTFPILLKTLTPQEVFILIEQDSDRGSEYHLVKKKLTPSEERIFRHINCCDQCRKVFLNFLQKLDGVSL